MVRKTKAPFAGNISKKKLPVVYDENNPHHHRGSKKFVHNPFLSEAQRKQGLRAPVFTMSNSYGNRVPEGVRQGRTPPPPYLPVFTSETMFPTAKRISRSENHAGQPAPPSTMVTNVSNLVNGNAGSRQDSPMQNANLIAFGGAKGTLTYPMDSSAQNIAVIPTPDINPFGGHSTEMTAFSNPKVRENDTKQLTLYDDDDGEYVYTVLGKRQRLIEDTPSRKRMVYTKATNKRKVAKLTEDTVHNPVLKKQKTTRYTLGLPPVSSLPSKPATGKRKNDVVVSSPAVKRQKTTHSRPTTSVLGKRKDDTIANNPITKRLKTTHSRTTTSVLGKRKDDTIASNPRVKRQKTSTFNTVSVLGKNKGGFAVGGHFKRRSVIPD